MKRFDTKRSKQHANSVENFDRKAHFSGMSNTGMDDST